MDYANLLLDDQKFNGNDLPDTMLAHPIVIQSSLRRNTMEGAYD